MSLVRGRSLRLAKPSACAPAEASEENNLIQQDDNSNDYSSETYFIEFAQLSKVHLKQMIQKYNPFLQGRTYYK